MPEFIHETKSALIFRGFPPARLRFRSGHNLFPLRLQAGTFWRQITIIFTDFENVKIKFRRKEYRKSFKDMVDFEKMDSHEKPTGKPNILWKMLFILSVVGGEFTIEDRDKLKAATGDDFGKKTKGRLATSLQKYFGLQDDPFYQPNVKLPDKVRYSYKTRFTIFHETITEKGGLAFLLNKGKTSGEGDDKLGINEGLEESQRLPAEKRITS